MPADAGLPDNPQRISVVCHCGKKLVVNSMQSGKRLKCPSCGGVVVVPPVQAGVVPHPAEATHHSERRFTRVLLMIGLWSLPVAAVVGGGAYIHLDAKWKQQARSDAANAEVREVVKGVEGSLKPENAKEGEKAGRRPKQAIAANEGSEKALADAHHEAVLSRPELASDALFDAAKAKFNGIRVDSAHSKVDATEFADVAVLLRRYVADPHATKKAEAEQLLAHYDLATSDDAALQTLMAMSDQQFAQFTTAGVLADYAWARKVKDIKFIYLRSSTLRGNLKTATRRREEIKLAEANSQKEAAKIAEAKRQESERLARAAADESKLPGVWRHKAGDGAPGEITLHSNGKINNPDGQDTWTFTGRTLVLRWANRHAPGGFWVDTCIVSEDRKNYRGSNQHKALIAGWKVDPTLAVAASKNADAAKKQQTAETDRYVEQQIEVLKSGRPVAAADEDAGQKQPARKSKKRAKAQPKGKGSVVLRRQAADNLRALGEAANAAVFALAEVASSDKDTLLRRKAIEALGEMGRCGGIRAIVPTLLETHDPEMANAAEDSLMKLLPATGGRLGMEDAIRLLGVRHLGNERLATVVESAWAASGFSEWAVVNELNQRALQKHREEAYWAQARAEKARREADPAWQKWHQAKLEREQAALRELQKDNPLQQIKDRAGKPGSRWPDGTNPAAPQPRGEEHPDLGGHLERSAGPRR